MVDLLDRDQVEALRAARTRPDGPGPGTPLAPGFHLTMYEPAEARRAAREAIAAAMQGALVRIGPDLRVAVATFLVKGPGGGAIAAHADWSYVDEATSRSLTVWCPLDDTDEHNGTLEVFPGSHRTVTFERAVNHRDHERHLAAGTAANDPLSIPLRAGQAVLMHSRLVHQSPPNRTAGERVAMGAVLAPAGAPLRHYWVGPDGDLARYEVGPDFHLTYEPGTDPGSVDGTVAVSVPPGTVAS